MKFNELKAKYPNLSYKYIIYLATCIVKLHYWCKELRAGIIFLLIVNFILTVNIVQLNTFKAQTQEEKLNLQIAIEEEIPIDGPALAMPESLKGAK